MSVSDSVRQTWKNRLRRTIDRDIHARTLSGFNTNIDKVTHVKAENIQTLMAGIDESDLRSTDASELEELHSRVDFAAALKECMSEGKSRYYVLRDHSVLPWINEVFSDHTRKMGGQAGIIANQMDYLGADSIAYTPLLSEEQAEMFTDGVRTPILRNGYLDYRPVQYAAEPEDDRKVNWVLEFSEGETVQFGSETVETPRANRLIISTRPEGLVMEFPDWLRPHLGELGDHVGAAFMAGYHYVRPTMPDGRSFNDYMQDTLRDLILLKQKNPFLPVHFEYVPMKFPELQRAMLSQITHEIASLGINETEITEVLRAYEANEYADAIEENESAYTLYRACVVLLRKFGLMRVQLHNLGYHVMVLRKPYPTSPSEVRQACLFGASVNAMKATHGGYVRRDELPEAAKMPLSDRGFEQLQRFPEEAEDLPVEEDFVESGILNMPDHFAVIVPAQVVEDPITTVGMGDTISSSTYAAEIHVHE